MIDFLIRSKIPWEYGIVTVFYTIGKFVQKLPIKMLFQIRRKTILQNVQIRNLVLLNTNRMQQNYISP